MTDRRNTDGNWQINYSWTQSYSAPSHNPFYNMSSGEIYRRLTLEEEMAEIERVDRWVDAMLTYPDAERIMNKIVEQGGRNA